MPATGKPPAYRRRKIRGRDVAYATFRDFVTGRKRDFWLGDYGTEESRSLYTRLLARWESLGRRLWDEPARDPAGDGGVTVTQICHSYLLDQTPKVSKSFAATLRTNIKAIRAQFGDLPAAEVGPNLVREWRTAMILADETRSSITRRVSGLMHIFRWAVSRELVPVTVLDAIRTLEPLRHNEGRRLPPVKPVDDAIVDATIAHLAPSLAAMVELQRITGMRPGEVCAMRTVDIDRSGKLWYYTPREHKTSRFGHERKIPLGPRAMKLLKPRLRDDAAEAYIFSPAATYAESLKRRNENRVTPAKQGNKPGTNRKAEPAVKPGEQYTVQTYNRAVQRAADAADAAALAKRGGEPATKCPHCGASHPTWRRHRAHVVAAHPDEKRPPHRSPTAVNRLVPRWHPHQLRHNYATAIRKQFGIEAARILLGHRTIDVTEIYAERDASIMDKIAKKLG